MKTKTVHETISLPDVPIGKFARVRSLPPDQILSSRLRELGIHENALLRFVGDSYGSIVFEVARSRFGLSKVAARRVLVSVDN